MHRIIVVEDERQTLAEVFEDLPVRRPDWDVAFVTGADSATCDEQPADVVVLDLRALDTFGLQLLGHLRENHPETTCIVLAAFAEPKLALRALARAQHCLTKPFAVRELEELIDRSLALKERLANPALRELLRDGAALPRVPLFSKLGDLIADDSATPGQLVEVVSQDAAIVERMLGLVNSTFFGISTTVKDPSEATAILGPTTLRALVLNLELFRAARITDCPGLDVEYLRSHALADAAVASRLVEGTNAWNHVRVAGLLHDLGRIVFASADPNAYAEALAIADGDDGSLAQAETQVFGFTHADVGACAANLWGLPWTIVEPIALHHDRSPTWFDEPFDERHAVYIAELLLNEGQSGETASVDQLTVALAVHGLEDELDGWRRTTAQCLEPSSSDTADEAPSDRPEQLVRDAG